VRTKQFIASALALLGAVSVQAESIVVGQTAAFTGWPAPSVIEMTAGAKLLIDAENAKGGINGRRIELIAMDDASDAKRAADNTEKLITEHKPVAMFLSRGTPMADAMLPVINKLKVPLIAPSTGAMSLREPALSLVFNVRASYQVEARKAVEQLVGMGFTRIGVIYVDDTFGGDAILGVMEGFKRSGATPLFVEKFERTEKDFTRLVENAAAAKPPAIVVIGATGATVAILSGLKAMGIKGYVATLSTNASSGFLKSIAEAVGENGPSVIVSQVFPGERGVAVPLVREMTELLNAARGHSVEQSPKTGPLVEVAKHIDKKDTRVSPAMLEGAAAAKVLIAGLKRCGADPTPAKLVTALESGRIDVGWPRYDIAYSRTNHWGIEFTELSIVSATGESSLAFKR
jgi:branched-chain amino acid transport system substrate-binding protein